MCGKCLEGFRGAVSPLLHHKIKSCLLYRTCKGAGGKGRGVRVGQATLSALNLRLLRLFLSASISKGITEGVVTVLCEVFRKKVVRPWWASGITWDVCAQPVLTILCLWNWFRGSRRTEDPATSTTKTIFSWFGCKACRGASYKLREQIHTGLYHLHPCIQESSSAFLCLTMKCPKSLIRDSLLWKAQD